MRMIKHGAIVLGSVIAVVAASAMVGAHEPKGSSARDRDTVTVEAPTTRVRSDEDGTKVQVRAPFSDVDVDTKRRKVRIRVPFFDGVVSW